MSPAGSDPPEFRRSWSVTNASNYDLASPSDDSAARLLGEGTKPLVAAARTAGLDPVPSHRTLLRAALSGRLESLLVAGRRVCSIAAVVRWVRAEQARRED
jgi:hypothetical protein